MKKVSYSCKFIIIRHHIMMIKIEGGESTHRLFQIDIFILYTLSKIFFFIQIYKLNDFNSTEAK